MEQHCQHNDELIAELREKMAGNDQEHISFRRRLNEHDDLLREQKGILLALERQGNTLETQGKTLLRIESRLDRSDKRMEAIEKEPAERWRAVVKQAITLLVAAVVGAVLMKLGIAV